jgi:putative membrane protein
MSIRLARGVALLGACALWAACSKSGNQADTTAAMSADTTKAAATTPPPAPTLTDANIAALLDEANAADSANGSLAASKGTKASVKDFGRMMMRDHHSLRKQGQDLAKKLNLTPQAPANDTLPAMAQKLADSLKATPKGAAFDKLYIDDEVGVHQYVLNLLQTAQGAAQDTSLKALITKAQPLIQAHLTKAQDIQSKLNSTATAADSTTGAKATKGTKGTKAKKS